jgi:uncharacterized protein
MLRSDEILDFLKQHKQDLEARFSVRRIGLFGSVLRGSASDRSDVDILVELVQRWSRFLGQETGDYKW